jgi:hypothetical protein
MKDPKVREIRLGAIYRLAGRQGLSRAETQLLLEERLQFAKHDARQLASHWYTTKMLREVTP